ncbi:VF530 family protein [Thiomicrorhabdus sp. 6S3-12]|uniref:VF530 family protein n=1 Tax=Thiomicrorhabdus sp. 6S3-12 TaxID=2819681 RepID=UPI001AADC54F|nr:DUF2132 domain-containing protein [Thiomicrorhabdus sp. 6S3-12]
MTNQESSPQKKRESKAKPAKSAAKKSSGSPRPRIEQTSSQRNNPLHGITLKTIVTELQAYYGWEGLAQKTRMNCFESNPSIKSSLTFLRKTDWARDKIEQLYLFTQREIIRERKAKSKQ